MPTFHHNDRSSPVILEALRTAGAMTAPELADFLDMPLRTVHRRLTRLHELKLIHLAPWRHPGRQGGRITPVYRFGPGRDHGRPPVQTRDEINARHRERHKRNREAAAATRPVLKAAKRDPLNPFAGLMAQVAR
ncbi:winged helix-turn-helix domain-containing protein [Geminicoccus flavidas]|uniref:winged helix-turn-helix domain-containing protein n=1 Tax=Geminicoccus flavidas TaxID=2506407 RepID=UPI001356E138|nr:winged helix-turn-helix domain-containing protein [Geminicoccus flavidas]